MPPRQLNTYHVIFKAVLTQHANYSAATLLYYFVPPMSAQHNKIKFPFWQYLNQPLFSRDSKLELNPRRFAYSWRIGLLERCLNKECDAKGPQQY